MSSEISPENEQFIEKQITSGAFHSRAEVLDAGIELLRMRNELLDRIDERRRQLDAGEFTDYDEQGLRKRFEELKERARGLPREAR
jgi:Arc/MetJ-type ribon-helix-helix transcriptional regulator